MSSLVSIRLNETALHALQAGAAMLHVSQTEYIRQAIDKMNAEVEQKVKAERLKLASQKVRANSVAVNAEFDGIEYDKNI